MTASGPRAARVPVATMQALSAAVGLSRPTLSKFFADPASVSPATRARIEAAMRRFDYTPNLLARNLNRRNSRLVGIMVPTFDDPFFAAFARAAETAATAAGLLPVVQSSHAEPATQARLLRALPSMNAAGVVVAAMDAPGIEADLAALNVQVPVVTADARIDVDLPFTGTRNDRSMALIAGYLCDTTHPGGPPPAFIAMPGVNRNAAARREAYEAELSRRGLAPRVVAALPHGLGRWAFEEAGRAGMCALLAEGLPVRAAVLCANDRLAIGALSAAFEAGRRVGRGLDADLRVAGHDDNPLSAFLCPSLTTVRQDVDGIAAAAVRLLVARIEGAGPSGVGDPEVLFEAELVVRQSA